MYWMDTHELEMSYTLKLYLQIVHYKQKQYFTDEFIPKVKLTILLSNIMH